MIKFPATLSEYTNGKLWKNGVKESIARRILVSFDTLKDKKERNLRKMYLANFYYEKGAYNISMLLVKQLLLEGLFVDEAILLMRDLCVKMDDYNEYIGFLKILSDCNKGCFPSWMLKGVPLINSILGLCDVVFTNKGEVVIADDKVEYYKDGKFVYSVVNNDFDAFTKNSAVEYLLCDGKIDEALVLLDQARLDLLSKDVRFLCLRTYIIIYCHTDRFEEAYERCKPFIKDNQFEPEMYDVYFGLVSCNSPNAKELREFFINYKGYNGLELCDMYSISIDMKDEEFWNKIYANNPLDPNDFSEGTLLLKGILSFNEGDYNASEINFCKYIDLYGYFGSGHFYKYYLKKYVKYLKKPLKTYVMPDKISTANIKEVHDFINKKALSRLKKISDSDDFYKDIEDNLTALDNVLSSKGVKLTRVAKIVRNLYKTGCPAVTDLVDRAIVNDECDIFVRVICLANFFMYSNRKECYLHTGKAKNYMTKIRIDEKRENFAYGMALTYAIMAMDGEDNIKFKNICKTYTVLYNAFDFDFSDIDPFAVFGVLYTYVNGFDDVEIEVVKKRGVSELIDLVADELNKNRVKLSDGEHSGEIFDFILRGSLLV